MIYVGQTTKSVKYQNIWINQIIDFQKHHNKSLAILLY